MILVLCIGGYSLYNCGRPVPVPMKQKLFDGVVYRRIIHVVPRPMIIHVVTVDTKSKGISFLVTPPDSQSAKPLNALTTTQFLEKFHLQLAVNGDRFSPWWSHNPADYYPHVGDPVTPFGFSASMGAVYWLGEVGEDGSARPKGMCIGLVRLAKMVEHRRRSISAAQTRYRSIIGRTISTVRSPANECSLSKEKLFRI